MSNLSEEEILDDINFCLEGEYITREHYEAIQGLLNLYNKEKEKNKELEHQQQVETKGRKILVNLNENLKEELNKEKEINQMFKDLLVDLVNQFAYEDDDPKTRGSSLEKLYTRGLSVLEDAFYVLNIDEAITREELWKLKKENNNE